MSEGRHAGQTQLQEWQLNRGASEWASEGRHVAAGMTAAGVPVPALVIVSKQGQTCKAGAVAAPMMAAASAAMAVAVAAPMTAAAAPTVPDHPQTPPPSHIHSTIFHSPIMPYPCLALLLYYFFCN